MLVWICRECVLSDAVTKINCFNIYFRLMYHSILKCPYQGRKVGGHLFVWKVSIFSFPYVSASFRHHILLMLPTTNNDSCISMQMPWLCVVWRGDKDQLLHYILQFNHTVLTGSCQDKKVTGHVYSLSVSIASVSNIVLLDLWNCSFFIVPFLCFRFVLLFHISECDICSSAIRFLSSSDNLVFFLVLLDFHTVQTFRQCDIFDLLL